MKIIISSFTYYPDNNGVSAVTGYIAEGLAQNNEVIVITDNSKKYAELEEIKNVKIVRITVNHKRINEWTGDKKKYVDFILSEKPDCFICVCTQTWTFDWIAPVLKKMGCIKVLYTHGYSTYKEQYHIIRDVLDRQISRAKNNWYWKRYYKKIHRYLKHFDIITHLSKSNSSYEYSQKYHIENNIIVGNAVDDVFFDLKRKNGEEAPFTYLCVSNFDDNKNQESLIRAFYRLREENVRLLLVGGDSRGYVQYLINLCKGLNTEYGYHDVEIRSNVMRDEVYRAYEEADVFVFSSKSEQYPLVLCEATVCGLPIISSDVGHARELANCSIYKSVDELTELMTIVINDIRCGDYKGNTPNDVLSYRQNEKVKKLETEIYAVYKNKIDSGEILKYELD